MRERRNDLPYRDVHTDIYTWTNPAYKNLYGSYDWGYSPGGAVIWDVPKRRWINRPDGKRVQAYKAVTHTKWRSFVDAGSMELRVSPTGYIDSSPALICSYDGGCGDLGLWGRDRCWERLPSTRDHWYDNWTSAKPSIASRTSLSVFLYEIRDIKRMFDLLPNKHFRLRDWRTVLQYANGLHLNYNFGWKPFLRDCTVVIEGLADVERRLHRFLVDANRSLTRRRGQSVTYQDEHHYYFNGSVWKRSGYWNGETRFTSNFMLSYEVPKMGVKEMYWRAVADTFGMKVGLAELWAVLPWSFVCDWFFNVGQYLEQFSQDWLAPWVTYIQGCHSAHSEYTYQMMLTDVPYPVSMDVLTTRLSHYDRVVGLPQFSGATDDLSADKIRLLISLVAGRII